ncbi:serrate RNA effector molecule [Cinnamomum micranthum f. kanehirae]|uniref:Serrate RNA effector molecule n=1 Tax=Cinnamomum micranthum f. kanehirae TaxID=337451 RepID=A0A3S3NGS0_9MAGN|nr:serrate RNA effector molecule [Cinnamomum micranthum f. kanehirae]
MAEVMDVPIESLDRSRERQPERTEGSPDDLPPPPPPRRRDRDSRERRDERDDRRYHDRNRSPGPVGPSRDRDRDYKRRLSPSPPPSSYRRHSSPRRSSPPPFKRSRRDDGGGYDNHRRGSPRFNHDYGGGYDRHAMGGRAGYLEERPHGRYLNRQSDWSDSGRAGSADIPNMGVTQREGLMSYKQFIQELEDDILPAEAERRYEEYRSEYISTQKRAYFAAHKDEEWLKDKYHPTNLVTVIERRNEHARTVAKEFLLDLQNGTLDLGPGVSASLAMQSGQGSDMNSEDEADPGGKRRRHGRGPTKGNDLLSAAPKAPPVSAEPRRIQADIEQAQALVRKLDKEKGIGENVLCGVNQDKGSIIIIRGLTTVKGLEGIELLDTLITYLWRIHGLDYYGMREMDEAKGLRHVRSEGKSFDEKNTGGADWENKLDSFWQGRLHGQDPLEKMTAKEKIDAAASEALDPYVRKIRDEKYGWKYGCGAKGCTKLFHAAEFVHKHLRLKHPELSLDLTSKVREDVYFQNYMNDADAPGGTPIMQLPIQKDKLQRRRPGLDSRLRDDRGNHREHDRADTINNDERYDRMENSPSRDYQSNTNVLEGGNPDDPMYDTYGAKGMRGASYPSDVPPPPVLMPVPGAGPLGPFVPAPPEFAMRMLRDQGGPSPYEENGGSRGRKGRSAPQVGGPAPILSVSQAFRQDPRRIRSYQDLDAPEDEVTVIDYRSL